MKLALNTISNCRICYPNIGKVGERFASHWLIKNHFHIVERNWKVPDGELDLIAIYDRCLHIIEVKTRKTDAQDQFSARHALDRIKQRKLEILAENYIYRRVNLLKKFRIKAHQIDLIAVNYRRFGSVVCLNCEHYENISSDLDRT